MFKQLFTSYAPHKGAIPRESPPQLKEGVQFSELRYRRLFETAQDGILILDASSGNIIDANPSLLKLLGYSWSELLGKELWQVGVFKDAADSKAAFVQLQKNECIRYDDMLLRTKDGRTIDAEFVGNAYMVGDLRVVQCNIRDITDRRKIEMLAKLKTDELERLSKSQENIKQAMLNVMEDLEAAKTQIELEKAKDEAIIASVGEGLIAVDTDKKIIIMNASAEKMLGWDMKDMIGREITSLPLEDEDGHILPLTKRPTYISIATGKPTNAIYHFVRKDKTRFPIAINVTPVKLAGKTIGAIDIFRDITQEKEIDRVKSEFVSLASHQLRTPLGISKWYLEAILAKDYFAKAPRMAQDYLHEVYKNNERLLALVRDLLSISRIDQGHLKSVSKSVHVLDIIQRVVKHMRILANANNISIRLKVRERHMSAILIDPLRVQEVIENLIINAITYSNASGIVEVTVGVHVGMIRIDVKDSGIGIVSKDKKKLFTKFFRSEAAIAKNPEGSGLGLYVVKSYVEDWGGSIMVQNNKGKGCTFTVTLPYTKKGGD